jgi:SAM-dependent methyltransferase
MNDAVEANRVHWDAVTPGHVTSDFYDLASFKAGRDTIDDVEAELVGDVAGLSLLHLQCHFGMDTMSWTRRGARATGIDFSTVAIEHAQNLAAELGLDTRFVVADVLTADLDETFDVVFTSHGVLGWLPELTGWGRTVARHLAPDGRFLLIESHPFLWMFDDERTDDAMALRYDYFSSTAVEFTETGSYANSNGPTTRVINRLHRVDEILGALVDAGLTITAVREYDRMAWQALPHMVRGDDGWWRLPPGDVRIPLMLAVTATRR